MLLEISGEITPERMKVGSQGKNNMDITEAEDILAAENQTNI